MTRPAKRNQKTRAQSSSGRRLELPQSASYNPARVAEILDSGKREVGDSYGLPSPVRSTNGSKRRS